MPADVTGEIKAALAKLTVEKRRIEQQTAALQEALRAVNGITGQHATAARGVARRTKRGRRRMTRAERKAVGRRMKAYWAKRRVGRSKQKKNAA
jgi:hypothetical protein